MSTMLTYVYADEDHKPMLRGRKMLDLNRKTHFKHQDKTQKGVSRGTVNLNNDVLNIT